MTFYGIFVRVHNLFSNNFRKENGVFILLHFLLFLLLYYFRAFLYVVISFFFYIKEKFRIKADRSKCDFRKEDCAMKLFFSLRNT